MTLIVFVFVVQGRLHVSPAPPHFWARQALLVLGSSILVHLQQLSASDADEYETFFFGSPIQFEVFGPT